VSGCPGHDRIERDKKAMGTFLGIAIVIVAFALGNTLPKFARNAFRLAMLARLSISVLNVMMEGGMIGANADASFFYSNAVERSSSIEDLAWDLVSLLGVRGMDAFSNIHALMQWISGGASFFLAHAFSLLGAALCLIIISKIWLLLVPAEYKRLPYILLIYSILPSVLTNQSYILREVWQSLCVFGIVWLSLHIQRYGYNITRILGVLIFTIAGCFLHVAMAIMINLIFLVGLLIQNKISLTRWYMMRPARLFKFGFILVLFLLMLVPLVIGSGYYQSIIEGHFLQNMDSFSEVTITEARADYGKLFDSGRPWTLLYSFAAYQTMPLPWRFGSVADLILFAENMFRILLLLYYLYYRKKLTQFHKDNMDALVLMWFLMELIWSAGTSNWGTASRHHVPAVGLLLIVGLASRYLMKPERLSIRKRQPTKQFSGQIVTPGS